MPKKKPGPSTEKQSHWPSLGLYVVRLNLRRNGPHKGTWRIVFKVPARLRPSGWPPTISLPRAKPYCKGRDDLEAIIRIKEDAAALYEALSAGRADVFGPEEIVARPGSIPWLIEKWGGKRLLLAVKGELSTQEVALNPGDDASDGWLNCEPRTRKLYIRSLRPVFAWSITVRHLHVNRMKPAQIRDFLDMWKDKPGQKKNVRDALSQLLGIAGEESELTINPLTGKAPAVKRQQRKRVKGGRKAKVERWLPSDVAAYAETARSLKAWRPAKGKRIETEWRGGSICVRLMYETGADSTDVTVWTKSEHLVSRRIKGSVYRGIDFDRGKTGVSTFIPLSASLLNEIDGNGSTHLVTDPFGAPYIPVVDDARLRGHLVTLREKATAAGAPYRVFDHLRHSAATEAEESGVETDKIRHLTAHKDSTMNRETYVQQSAEITVEIQRRRGIIS